MNKITIALLALVAVCVSLPSSAQTSDDMQAMMAYATPGDIHKMLARSAGSWAGTVTMWMKPGAQPMGGSATSVNEMILGGRYLQSKNTGMFMGQPFEGIGVTAYDNSKKAFVNTWIDNMGTGIMTMTGVWDDATKSISFSGAMVDPVSGKDIPVKEVWRFIDDNNQVLDMYSTMGSQEFKNMEIKYTRK